MSTESDTSLDRRRIYDVDQAAEHFGVSRAVVLDWIRERGLRALPVGKVGKRGPRDYRILGAWMDEFLEAESVVSRIALASPCVMTPEPRAPRRSRAASAEDLDAKFRKLMPRRRDS